MDVDWKASPYPGPEAEAAEGPAPRDVEEALEDPFGLSILPDSPRFSRQSRYFWLGRTLAGRGLFAVYLTDGKRARVFAARWTTPAETYFYDRCAQEM